jgi:hypothetical protein
MGWARLLGQIFALRCVSLHFDALHCTLQHFIAFRCTLLHFVKVSGAGNSIFAAAEGKEN